MRRTLDVLAALGLVAAIGLHCAPAHAAEFTDLLDAADDFDDLDEATWDPFDFHLEPRFTYKSTSARVTREAPCVPASDPNASDAVKTNPRLVVDEGRCPREARTIFNKEMLFTQKRAQLDLTLRAGLYKDLELRFNVPYVFVQSRQLTYDNESLTPSQNVTSANSSVDPRTDCDASQGGRCITREANNVFSPTDTASEQINKLDRFNAYRYFDLQSPREYIRGGFAEPSIGLHWAMFNDQRDDTKATLLLGLDYTMPIVPIATSENDAVGRGMHELKFRLASSKKFKWIEPYFGLEYLLPFASANSPIGKVDPENQGQVFTRPPMRGDFTIGTEFIPYENPKTGARYAIDLRFSFGYISEGRDYSPLFDHLGKSRCNGKSLADVLPSYDGNGQLTNPDDVACAWVVRQPSNGDPRFVYDLNDLVDQNGAVDGNVKFGHDGILTVEARGVFRGSLGFYLQPNDKFQFNILGAVEHQQEHFLSNARTGRDIEDEQIQDDTVDLEGPDARFERNPVFNPSYDSTGDRFRIQNYTTWILQFNAALQF